MTTKDLIARSRWEGARRRAERDGLPLPVEPTLAVAGVATTRDEVTHGGASTLGVGTPEAGASTPAWRGVATAELSPDAVPGATGPWFDRRGFFVGWLAMVVALIAFQSALAATAAGLAAAYFVSRRRRVLNAVVAVAGGYAAGTLATIVLVVIALVSSR